ncbi:hypothetical protein Fmac_026361 [Flemingia macrophylla]|uniref:RRM domain-containing protein n=1 Tax=Flemingia macrophylla TaxID=520843 RepID=A0ABD1LEN5_9FABA
MVWPLVVMLKEIDEVRLLWGVPNQGFLKENNERARGEKKEPKKGRITTFYVEKLLGTFKEFHLWKNFQQWGRVWEIFLPPRRNHGGHRFGFVRYLDVTDERRLEAEFDKIRFGNIKLNVNIPKYTQGMVKEEKTALKHQA